MVKIDLITGFLGAGKTTFLRKYVQYLVACGEHVGILENDFGAINVDMLLLHDLRSENCELEMVSGGCDADCHRRRFKTKLIAMRMSGYTRVVVEPSGIYDVDEFFDALREEPLDGWYEIGNVIAVVDARLEENLSAEATYLFASEAANAGKIVLSHTDEVTDAQALGSIAHLNRALAEIGCKRQFSFAEDVIVKNLMELSDADLEQVAGCGYKIESYRKEDTGEHAGFDSIFLMEEKISAEALEAGAKRIFEDAACGNVFRIKGFLENPDGTWTECNATKDAITFAPIAVGQEVIIVIGEGMDEERIKKILSESNLARSFRA